MNSHRIYRRFAALALLLGGSTTMPDVLAACDTSTNPITGVETILCCGSVACCWTKWRGSELVGQGCY